MQLLTPELGLFFWTLVAFIGVFLILKKFAWKPILDSLNEREKGIADSISTAERVKGEMSQLKSDNEKLMAEAREQRNSMISEAKEIKARMIGEAKELAKEEANKIIIEAQQQIHQQKMAAITEIKNEIGKLSVDVAERILRKQLGSAEGQEAYNKLLTDELKLN